MARRVNRDRKGVIHLYGTPQPQPKPRPPSRKHRPATTAQPPPVVHDRTAPAPAQVTRPMVALSPHSQGSNGAGEAKYTTSRFCQCDKPLVIADKDYGRFDVAIEDRCLRCGKPPGEVNATVNNSRPPLPDEPA